MFYHFYENKVNIDYSMFEFMKYFYKHPDSQTKWHTDKKRIDLIRMEHRNSTPEFAKSVLQVIRDMFPNNVVTLHAFMGLDQDSKSFNIHKDKAHVLYLQVFGETEFSIWENDPSLDHRPDNLEPEQAICLEKRIFKPGDAVWVRRGTYHYIKPLTPRVSFSFGVEGDLDLESVNFPQLNNVISDIT